MYVPFFLVLAVMIARVLPVMGDNQTLALVANLSPVIALALCGGVCFPRRLAMPLLLGGFLVSDLVLNAAYGVALLGAHTLVALVVYSAIIGGGWLLRGHSRHSRQLPQLPQLLGATVVGVAVFYLVTNTASFLMSDGYPRSLGGWLQCLTVGLPGFPPTWSFLLKSLASNSVFCVILWSVFHTRQATTAGEARAESPIQAS